MYNSIAASETVSRMATALNRTSADAGPYFESAKAAADNNHLDFLEFVRERWNHRFLGAVALQVRLS